MTQRIDSDQTVAVTGAGGFIASHLTHALLRMGYTVRAFVHYNAEARIGRLADVIDHARREDERWLAEEKLKIIHGDISDPRSVRDLVSDCDAIFHLAALIGVPYSFVAPASYLQTNVHGTFNLLEACREECPERVIFTSTSEVYGTALTTPMDESHPLQAQSPYAASKIAADKLAESYFHSFEMPLVTIRPFNTYGPRQTTRGVIPTILIQAVTEDCDAIRLGDLETVRDLNFVDDTVTAFLCALQAPLDSIAGHVYNIGHGKGHSIREIAEAALGLLDLKKPIVSEVERIRPGSSEVRVLIADSSRARTELNWEPKISLEEGLRRTAKWVARHKDEFDPTIYRI